MKSFPKKFARNPAGSRPHILVSVAAATQVQHAACRWALSEFRPDWDDYFVQLPQAQMHLTLASADLLSADIPTGQRRDWENAVRERVIDLDPFQILLGPLLAVTYSIWVDVNPSADAALAELSARCRAATRAVFGHSVVADPDRWTRPHAAAAHCTRDLDIEDLGGWLAHARTPAGVRPEWASMMVTGVTLVDQDSFAAGGPRWTSAAVDVPIGDS